MRAKTPADTVLDGKLGPSFYTVAATSMEKYVSTQQDEQGEETISRSAPRASLG